MSINIGDNFNYQGKKFLDNRQTFKTLAEMKECNEVPLGFVTYCVENGKRYEYLDYESIDETTGKWREFKAGVDIDTESLIFNHSHIGEHEPTDDSLIWFDTGEGNSSNITYDNPILNELFACIRTLQVQVQQLQADVEYIKINGGGTITPTPDDDKEEIVESFLILEDGGLFLLEDGSTFLLEESEVIINDSILSLEDGGLFLLEDGSYMILENNIEMISESLLLLENSSKILLENGANILLES